MLEVNHVVLDESVVDDVIDVQLEPPGHRHFSLAGEIDEVSDHLIHVRFEALSLDRNAVGIIGFDRLFLNVSAFALALVAHADLFESHIAVVELVSDEDWGIEGDGHVVELEGAVGHQLEDQAF